MENMKHVNKIAIVFKALSNGTEINFDNAQYKLFKPDDEINTPTLTGICEKYVLALKMQCPKNTYQPIDITVAEFCEMISAIKEDDICLLAVSNTLKSNVLNKNKI
jgi:hypothetical protein